MRRTITAGLAVGVLALFSCGDDRQPSGRDSDGRVTRPEDVSVLELDVGDCLTPPADVAAELEQVRVVPCADSHTQEVFALVTHPGEGAYPGTPALSAFADVSCLEHYQEYVGVAYQDSKFLYTYLLPSSRSWTDGNDRRIVCIVTAKGEQLTGSVKGSGY